MTKYILKRLITLSKKELKKLENYLPTNNITKISKEEISIYTDIENRLEEWLEVFIKKMMERNLLSSIIFFQYHFPYMIQFQIRQ